MFQEFFTKLLANPITMIDLETLDVSPRAVVLSIGAIVFDFKRMQTLRTYEATLQLEDQTAAGRTVKTSTVHWWLEQSSEARLAITSPDALARKSISYDLMLKELKSFLPSDGFVTAKPAMFDLAILSDMHGGDLFRHRRGFDMHTLCCVIDPNRELCPQNALAHSALADARWQLEWLVNIVKKMDDWAGRRSRVPTNYSWSIIQKVEPELRSGAEIDALNSGVKAA